MFFQNICKLHSRCTPVTLRKTTNNLIMESYVYCIIYILYKWAFVTALLTGGPWPIFDLLCPIFCLVWNYHPVIFVMVPATAATTLSTSHMASLRLWWVTAWTSLRTQKHNTPGWQKANLEFSLLFVLKFGEKPGTW